MDEQIPTAKSDPAVGCSRAFLSSLPTIRYPTVTHKSSPCCRREMTLSSGKGRGCRYHQLKVQNGDYVNSRSDESDERRVSLAPCLRAPRLKLTQRETFHWLPPCLTVYSEQVEASNKHTVLACGNTGWKRYNNIISAAKGYRTVQSGIFVEEGAWYFEVVLAHLRRIRTCSDWVGHASHRKRRADRCR